MAPIIDGPPVGELGQNKLVLTSVGPYDAGFYTCVAQSKLGTVTKNFTVNIMVKNQNVEEPTQGQGLYGLPAYTSLQHLTNEPENTTVENGGRAVLECRAKVKQINLNFARFLFGLKLMFVHFTVSLKNR